MLEIFKIQKSDYEKKNFSASDFGKLGLDLYFKLTGEEETNPVEWTDTLKFGAGKGVETEFLNILKASGIVDEAYNQEVDGRIEVERECGLVTGYIDAIAKEEHGAFPIEVKSINNKNAFDIKNYNMGMPRENYVGQLAVYMDAKGKDKGVLLVGSIDGLSVFWYEVEHIGDRKYQVKRFKTLDSIIKSTGVAILPGKDGYIEITDGVTVDLNQEYSRWLNIKNHVDNKQMPDIYEAVYKYDIETLDWTTISKDKISKARNNKAVVGDWQIIYSNYKDKIIELQGAELGYTNEELFKINELTSGYTTWK